MTLTLYRIVSYFNRLYYPDEYGDDLDLDFDMADEEVQFHLDDGVGVHWTDNPNIAASFATPNVNYVAILWEAEVDEDDIASNEEIQSEYAEEGVMPFWFEREYFVRPGSQVKVTSAWVYPDLAEGNDWYIPVFGMRNVVEAQQKSSLSEFVKEVQRDFRQNKQKYLESVKEFLPPGIMVYDVELVGSYASGNPREDSDVDLKIRYSGNLHPDKVYSLLVGRIFGYGGVFDIVPIREGSKHGRVRVAKEVDFAGLLWDVEERRGKRGVEVWSTYSNEYWDAIYYIAEWFGGDKPWDAKVLINPRLFLEKLGYEVLWSDKNHSEYCYSEFQSNKDALFFLSNFEKWVSTNSGKREVEEWALQYTGVRSNTAAALPPLTPKQRELLKDLQSYDEVIKYDTYDKRTQKSLLVLEQKGLVETRWDVEDENRLWVLWAYPNPRYRKYEAQAGGWWYHSGLADDKSIWGSMEEEVKAGQLTHDKISQHFRQTKEVMSGIDPNAELAFDDRKGKCYEFAGRYVINNPGSVLIHGTIEGMGKPPLGHAWVKDTDGEIFEPTTGQHYSEREFRLIFNPVVEREYEREEARVKMMQEGHFGPWHATAGRVRHSQVNGELSMQRTHGYAKSKDNGQEEDIVLWGFKGKCFWGNKIGNKNEISKFGWVESYESAYKSAVREMVNQGEKLDEIEIVGVKGEYISREEYTPGFPVYDYDKECEYALIGEEADIVYTYKVSVDDKDYENELVNLQNRKAGLHLKRYQPGEYLDESGRVKVFRDESGYWCWGLDEYQEEGFQRKEDARQHCKKLLDDIANGRRDEDITTAEDARELIGAPFGKHESQVKKAQEIDSPFTRNASDLFNAFLNEWSDNVWGFSLDSELEEEGIFSENIFSKSLGGVIEYDEFNGMYRAGIIIQPIDFMQNVYGIKEGRDFPLGDRPQAQGHKVIDDTDDLISFDEAEEWVKEWPKENRGLLLKEAEYWYEFFQKKFPEHLASREAMPRHRPGLYEYFDEMSDGTKVSIMVERLDEDTGRAPGDYGFNWWTYEIQRSDDLSPIATTGDVGIFPTKRDAIENARNFIEVAYKDPQWGWVVGSTLW